MPSYLCLCRAHLAHGSGMSFPGQTPPPGRTDSRACSRVTLVRHPTAGPGHTASGWIRRTAGALGLPARMLARCAPPAQRGLQRPKCRLWRGLGPGGFSPWASGCARSRPGRDSKEGAGCASGRLDPAVPGTHRDLGWGLHRPVDLPEWTVQGTQRGFPGAFRPLDEGAAGSFHSGSSQGGSLAPGHR